MDPAVFLDRDNTLIANDGDLGDPEKVRLKDGVPAGLKALREAGYRLVVVTNQAGVARGVFSEDDVDAVHQKIAALVEESADTGNLIDRFYYCPYHPEGVAEEYKRDHPWRKPHPGMLLQAAHDMQLDLARSWMVGDQDRDVRAGRSAGCRTVLIGGNGDASEDSDPTGATAVATDFAQAVQTILQRTPPRTEAGDNGPVPVSRRQRRRTAADDTDLVSLRRSILELTDEVRSDRMRQTEFTPLRLAAGLSQLLVLLLALLGLLQLGNLDAFMKWMICAVLLQLVTITMVLLDLNR